MNLKIVVRNLYKEPFKTIKYLIKFRNGAYVSNKALLNNKKLKQ